MQKTLILVAISLMLTACSTLETTYKVGEVGVKTFVPKKKRDELGLKEKNEFVKDIYTTLKESKEK